MSPVVVTVVTAALIVLSAFFVVIEFALLGARRHRLEEQAERSASARAAVRGMNELTVMLAGAQLGITACTFALGAVTKPAVDAWLGPVFAGWGAPEWLAGGAAFALSLLFVTFLHLVVGEMAPKSWAIAHPELAARIIGLPARAFIWPFRPLLLWINHIANRLVARVGIEPVERAAAGGHDADTLRHLVEYSTEVGVLEPEITSHISHAIELQTLTVADIVRPDAAPTAVGPDATLADVRRAAARTKHLRILVLAGTDERPGVVHVRDTLLEPADAPVGAHRRDAHIVRPDAPVHEVLRDMRERGMQLAVVMDDGRMTGVVTIADIIARVLPRQSTAA
jgi:CBS domain containing-hemolysin-like protein